MAERGFDRPKGERRQLLMRRPRANKDRDGEWAEAIARFLGTPKFIVWLSIFVIAWIAWNLLAPDNLVFDRWGFVALTLMLSLQASYAAPLILLAQNRQADRDRVGAEQDRQRAERSLADTEYLAREVAALRHAINETATRDFLRSELRGLLEEIRADDEAAEPPVEPRRSTKTQK